MIATLIRSLSAITASVGSGAAKRVWQPTARKTARLEPGTPVKGRTGRRVAGPPKALEDIGDELGPSERPCWQHADDSPLTLLLHAFWALQASFAANDASLPNYAARYRRGERISTAVVESMVNRVIGQRMTKRNLPLRGWIRAG